MTAVASTSRVVESEPKPTRTRVASSAFVMPGIAVQRTASLPLAYDPASIRFEKNILMKIDGYAAQACVWHTGDGARSAASLGLFNDDKFLAAGGKR